MPKSRVTKPAAKPAKAAKPNKSIKSTKLAKVQQKSKPAPTKQAKTTKPDDLKSLRAQIGELAAANTTGENDAYIEDLVVKYFSFCARQSVEPLSKNKKFDYTSWQKQVQNFEQKYLVCTKARKPFVTGRAGANSMAKYFPASYINQDVKLWRPSWQSEIIALASAYNSTGTYPDQFDTSEIGEQAKPKDGAKLAKHTLNFVTNASTYTPKGFAFKHSTDLKGCRQTIVCEDCPSKAATPQPNSECYPHLSMWLTKVVYVPIEYKKVADETDEHLLFYQKLINQWEIWRRTILLQPMQITEDTCTIWLYYDKRSWLRCFDCKLENLEEALAAIFNMVVSHLQMQAGYWEDFVRLHPAARTEEIGKKESTAAAKRIEALRKKGLLGTMTQEEDAKRRKALHKENLSTNKKNESATGLDCPAAEVA